MNRLVFGALLGTLFLLSACAHIEEYNAKYPLNINSHVIGHRVTITVNSVEDGPVYDAQVRVIDDINQVVVDKPLDSQGYLRFRTPSLATHLIVVVTDSEGLQGRRILQSYEIRDVGSHNVKYYY